MYNSRLTFLAISILLAWMGTATDAWVIPSSQTQVTSTTSSIILPKRGPRISSTKLNGWLDILSPYESKIPEELKDEIYQAEANTPAAKERGQRVALLALVALIGILFAFFNGFLTELRAGGEDGTPGLVLADSQFAWVVSNPVTSFLFTNAIGGAICLLGGAGAGLLAEAELDSKRINAEKIYEELERRRSERSSTPAGARSKQQKKMEKAKNKKRRSGKEAKRLGALSEVLAVDNTKEAEELVVTAATETDSVASDGDAPATSDESIEESNEKGLMGGIKDLYKKADNMAASQALLLNKKLEEAGVVDKITDETGLKVIGKEEAEKLVNEKAEAEEKQTEKK